MESRIEAFLVSFATVMLCLIVYRQFVKRHTPKEIQNWIGL
jgi:hypothetical protein